MADADETLMCRITQHYGRINGIPVGEDPTIDLPLEPGQYVANVDLHSLPRTGPTVDWLWNAYVITPPRPPSRPTT